MEWNLGTRFVAWLKRCELRGDAWAAKRLTSEEYADAAVLDQALKRDWWKWLGTYAAFAAAGTVVTLGLIPAFGWLQAFGFSNLMCVSLLLCFASAWYGYRKYSGKPAWRTIGIFVAMMVLGLVASLVLMDLTGRRPLYELTGEKLARLVAVALLMGTVIAVFLFGIASLRSREVAQRNARLQAELRALQAQVEPHFLFNTLSNLRYLVQTGSADALPMLDHLIQYLRTALPEFRAETSTLGREAELVRAYLEILKLRMGGALEVAIDVPDDLAGEPFPPLMLMTLVENAIKHGVAPVGRGRIAVRATREGGRLRVSVEDDGRGLGEPLGKGVGLANVRERLLAVYGQPAKLDLVGGAGGGTVATIEIPA